jgi:hypothetical protein
MTMRFGSFAWSISCKAEASLPNQIVRPFGRASGRSSLPQRLAVMCRTYRRGAKDGCNARTKTVRKAHPPMRHRRSASQYTSNASAHCAGGIAAARHANCGRGTERKLVALVGETVACGGPRRSTEAFAHYGGRPFEGHWPGDGCSQDCVRPGLSVSSPRERPSRSAGLGVSRRQESSIRPRLFLAPAQTVPLCVDTEDPNGVLEREVRLESCA